MEDIGRKLKLESCNFWTLQNEYDSLLSYLFFPPHFISSTKVFCGEFERVYISRCNVLNKRLTKNVGGSPSICLMQSCCWLSFFPRLVRGSLFVTLLLPEKDPRRQRARRCFTTATMLFPSWAPTDIPGKGWRRNYGPVLAPWNSWGQM